VRIKNSSRWGRSGCPKEELYITGQGERVIFTLSNL
jgi:hypothetical protein